MAWNNKQKIALPEYCHEDDHKWIREQLKKLYHIQYQDKARKGYSSAYQKAHKAEPLPHRKDGKARQAANTRLLNYIRKIVK